ncbi:PREDICTED: transmembrane protein 221 [Charadrius vociferus]|uniref:transmembrane protein 221 n=1 Tax=Charadrius vociferus TaxID=50402 RepID=UPI000521A3B6|nr:PREDICTED: transmembrane protein 221 [Charadrius vociferus]
MPLPAWTATAEGLRRAREEGRGPGHGILGCRIHPAGQMEVASQRTDAKAGGRLCRCPFELVLPNPDTFPTGSLGLLELAEASAGDSSLRSPARAEVCRVHLAPKMPERSHRRFGHQHAGGAGVGAGADWFLLDSRTVRHAAIGLFCCGVSVYLTALAIYMLLLFELEAGIASACILSSGIIVLLITVTHALVRASQVSRRSRSEVSHTLYENDSAQHGESSTSDLNNKNAAASRPRPEIHREFSFPPFLERKSQLGSPASRNLTSSGSPGLRSEKESYNLPRTHRTLSAESGLLQAQGKPWNGVTEEMRNVLSRKPGASGKDSTLV